MTETSKTRETHTPLDRSSKQDVVVPSSSVNNFLKQDVGGVVTDSGLVKTQSTSNIGYLNSVDISNVGSDDGDSFPSVPDHQYKGSSSLKTSSINTESCVQSNDTLTPEKDSLTTCTGISLSQQSDNTQSYMTPANSDEWSTQSNDIPINADLKVSTVHQQSDKTQVCMTLTNDNEASTQSNDTLNIVESSSLPNSDNSQLFMTPTDSIQSCAQSDINLTSVQDLVASDHQDAVDQLPIATPAPPTSVSTDTTADLDPEQATRDWEFSVSELVCDFQPPSEDIKMLTSEISNEAVFDCEKLFPDIFNSQGDGYVLPALSCCPRRRVPNDVLRRETQK